MQGIRILIGIVLACASSTVCRAQEVSQPRAEPKPPVRITDRVYPYIGTEALAPPQAAPDNTDARSTDRAVVCDPFAINEGESNCGINAQGQPFDTLNGGCGSTFQFFYPLFCEDIVCGTSVFTGAVRDGDWYEVNATQQSSLTWEVTPDFDAIIGLAGGTGGVPDCGMVTGITPFTIVPRGETRSITVCVNAGTYWFVVLPDFGQAPFPCGRVYEARISCATPCLDGGCCVGPFCQVTPGRQACETLGGIYQGDGTECLQLPCTPPANDECINAQTFTVGDTLIADLRLATMSGPLESPNCAPNSGVGSVWFKFTGTGQTVRIDSCDSDLNDPNASDAIISVYSGSCGGLIQRWCSDDAGCGATGLQAALCTGQTNPSTTYYVQVLAWSDSSRGVYTITTDQPCTDPLPPGACCIPTTFGPFCSVTTQQECADFSGVFHGSGSTCPVDPGVLCAGVETPVNDDCFSATLLTSGVPVTGGLAFANSSGTFEDCGLPINEARDVWYRVVGTGRTLTVSLCNETTNFDAQLHVYCDNCFSSTYTCVAANDDEANGTCGLSPEVSWCSENGAEYYVLVTGVNGAVGDFAIELTDDFVICNNPVDCFGDCGPSCPPGAVNENEEVCGPGYVDSTNGGCGSSPQVFGAILPGQTICGGSGTFEAGSQFGRDVDWYRFTITQRCEVTWELQANFLVETFLLNDQCGSQLESFGFARGNACQSLEVTAVLDPGTYGILISPQFFQGVSCINSAWVGTLNCTPTQDNGACCLAVDTCIETTEANCIELGGGYAADGVACATVTCTIQQDCPGDFNGDGLVTASDFNLLALNFGIASGATLQQGDANGDGAVNALDFNILALNFGNDCNNTQTPLGACCTGYATCALVTPASCSGAGGVYAGDGVLCGDVNCDPCPEDLNGDSAINSLDFNLLAQNFGATSGATRGQGDINLDGAVNAVDFNLLASVFGQACA